MKFLLSFLINIRSTATAQQIGEQVIFNNNVYYDDLKKTAITFSMLHGKT